MKNTFQISKQQITYLSEILNATAQKALKEMFPEAFEPELIAGIWYKNPNNKAFLYLQKISECDNLTVFGHNSYGDWVCIDSEPIEVFREFMKPASEEEVFERLKAEAIKRGFKKGVTVDRDKLQSFVKSSYNIVELDVYNCNYSESRNSFSFGGYIVFEKGIWAEICITKEEAEKELGKKII